MKVQCPNCREIVEMEIFSTTEAGLFFDCPGCGNSNFIASPEAREKSAPEPPSETPAASCAEIVCPKCGHAQNDSYACHLCGLVFAKFDAAGEPPEPPAARDLWLRIEAGPQDEDLHEEFIKASLAAGRPDYAARRYRVLSRKPGRQELAEKMLARLQAKSQAQLAPVALAPGAVDNPRRWGKMVTWILLAASAALLAYLLYNSASLIDKMK
ncbi:MAG TPA: hypothetical protein VM425_15345 [Myxococcota bacterium]|nr:hypothetical protein [Myxococcota bacterium]